MSIKGYAESVLSIFSKNVLAIVAIYFAFVDSWTAALAATVAAFYINQSRILWLLELTQFEREFNKE